MIVSGSASMRLTNDPGERLLQTVSGGNATEFVCRGNSRLAECIDDGTLTRR